MKRKLRIDELSVASFPTEAEEVPEQQGTVRGMQIAGTWNTCITCYAGQYTCAQTCPRTCHVTCQTCITCVNAPCP
jgi:hypothetical protein